MVSISIVAENKPDAHQTTTCTDNESLQHLTIAVLLIKILFFFRPLSTNVQRWPPDPYFAFSSLVPHFSEEWKCGKV